MDRLPDLIFVSEIWIFSDEVNDFKIPDYSFYALPNNSYAAGGVGVFCKNSLDCPAEYCELVSADVMKILCKIGSEEYCFICCYRLQLFSINFFNNELDNLLLNEKADNLVLIGDFNIDILANCESTDNYLSILAKFGLFPFINDVTRPRSGTCIDHVFCRFRSFQESYDSFIYDFGITDHCMVGLSVRIDISETRRPEMQKSTFVNFDELNNLLRYESWSDVYLCNNILDAYPLFLKIFQGHLQTATHEKQTPKKCMTKIKPWINNDLVRRIKLKNKLSLKCLKHPNNLSLKKRYKNISNAIKKEIPQVRDNFYLSKFESCSNNIKKQWSLLNEITNKTKNNSNLISIKLNDQMCSDSSIISNEFNKYFSTLASSVNLDFPSFDDGSIIDDDPCPNSFVFNDINALEVVKTINSLNNSNSRGFDNISNRMLKNVAYNIADILAYLFNLSVSSGIMPNELKTAIVIPLYKKGDRHSIENYRPISLLPVIAKVFEKLIKTRMVSFLAKTNFFSSKQYGFRSGCSTEDALLNFCSFVLKELDNKRFCASMFVDITKAFDTVNHQILLNKLYAIGFRGHIFHWFSSYLKNRTQKVKVGSSLSNTAVISMGVPQGSV